MLRNALFVVLSLSLTNAPAMAEDPGSASYCHGYIKKALGALPVDGLDRNDMWLAWNETVRLTIVEGEIDKTRYQAGRDAYSAQAAAGNVEAMREVTNGECELGKNPIWRWW